MLLNKTQNSHTMKLIPNTRTQQQSQLLFTFTQDID